MKLKNLEDENVPKSNMPYPTKVKDNFALLAAPAATALTYQIDFGPFSEDTPPADASAYADVVNPTKDAKYLIGTYTFTV
jgi:hypothetical protein